VPQILDPKSPQDFIDKNNFYVKNPTDFVGSEAGNTEGAVYFGYRVNGVLAGISSYVVMYGTVAQMQNTMVDPTYRRMGIGTMLNNAIEEHAKETGITKLVSHVYTSNHISLMLKIKQGYLVEGLLRDHDGEGIHEYILGKKLGE